MEDDEENAMMAAMGFSGFGKSTGPAKLDPNRFDKMKRADALDVPVAAPARPARGPQPQPQEPEEDSDEDEGSDDEESE